MLDELIVIRNKLSLISYAPNEISGSISPNKDDLITLQHLAENNCVETFVKVGSKNKPINQLQIGDSAEIKIYPLNLKGEKYFENEGDLIESVGQKYPNYLYYVHSLKYKSDNPSKPPIIRYFEEISQLIEFLVDISDYQKQLGNYKELVFFQAKQLVISTEYTAANINEIYNVSDLISHINSSADKEERRIIFTNELIAFLEKVLPISQRFKFLIKNFNDVFLIYKKSHSLYLEKYSYQKFKSEIDKEIIEYSKKIQSVINDAQGKLVAIPAAFLLIIGQFDLTGKKLFFNIALLLSSLVFSILLEVLLRNQFSALEFISDDVKRFKNNFDVKKASVIGDDFNAIFYKIDILYKKQKGYLSIIRYLVWLSPLFALCLFLISLIDNSVLCILMSILGR